MQSIDAVTEAEELLALPKALPSTVQDEGNRRHSHADSTMDSIGSKQGNHRHAYAKYKESHKEHRKSEELQEESWPDPTKYNQRSLFILSLKNPLRRFLIASIEWKWWDRTVLLLILLNTLQLGFIYNPFDVDALRPDSTVRDLWSNVGMVQPPPQPLPPLLPTLCSPLPDLAQRRSMHAPSYQSMQLHTRARYVLHVHAIALPRELASC